MKNLTNCGLREFLAQTNKIRHSVEKWLKLTDLAAIRARQPDYPEGATKEERDRLLSAQASANINAMLDAMLEKHPEETAVMLAQCCFIEPEDIDSHPTREYMGAFADMIADEEVLRFFTSLLKLAQMAGLTA